MITRCGNLVNENNILPEFLNYDIRFRNVQSRRPVDLGFDFLPIEEDIFPFVCPPVFAFVLPSVHLGAMSEMFFFDKFVTLVITTMQEMHLCKFTQTCPEF